MKYICALLPLLACAPALYGMEAPKVDASGKPITFAGVMEKFHRNTLTLQDAQEFYGTLSIPVNSALLQEFGSDHSETIATYALELQDSKTKAFITFPEFEKACAALWLLSSCMKALKLEGEAINFTAIAKFLLEKKRGDVVLIIDEAKSAASQEAVEKGLPMLTLIETFFTDPVHDKAIISYVARNRGELQRRLAPGDENESAAPSEEEILADLFKKIDAHELTLADTDTALGAVDRGKLLAFIEKHQEKIIDAAAEIEESKGVALEVAAIENAYAGVNLIIKTGGAFAENATGARGTMLVIAEETLLEYAEAAIDEEEKAQGRRAVRMVEEGLQFHSHLKERLQKLNTKLNQNDNNRPSRPPAHGKEKKVTLRGKEKSKKRTGETNNKHLTENRQPKTENSSFLSDLFAYRFKLLAIGALAIAATSYLWWQAHTRKKTAAN